MMNKNAYAQAYGVVLAITFAALLADLIFGFWPHLHVALLLWICIIFAIDSNPGPLDSVLSD